MPLQGLSLIIKNDIHANFMKEKISFVHLFNHSASFKLLGLTGRLSSDCVWRGGVPSATCRAHGRGAVCHLPYANIRRVLARVISSHCSLGRLSTFSIELVFIFTFGGKCSIPCFASAGVKGRCDGWGTGSVPL